MPMRVCVSAYVDMHEQMSVVLRASECFRSCEVGACVCERGGADVKGLVGDRRS